MQARTACSGRGELRAKRPDRFAGEIAGGTGSCRFRYGWVCDGSAFRSHRTGAEPPQGLVFWEFDTPAPPRLLDNVLLAAARIGITPPFALNASAMGGVAWFPIGDEDLAGSGELRICSLRSDAGWLEYRTRFRTQLPGFGFRVRLKLKRGMPCVRRVIEDVPQDAEAGPTIEEVWETVEIDPELPDRGFR